jgi:hypothetical protein
MPLKCAFQISSLTRCLSLKVLSVGKAYPPNIVYKYTVMTHNYHWVVRGEWTACDKVCHGRYHVCTVLLCTLRYQARVVLTNALMSVGERRRVVSCVRAGDSVEVDDGYCSYKAKPERDAEECNTHCTLV